jgi:hypothetical protein
VVKCSLKIGDRSFGTHTLSDSADLGIAFVDKDFVRHHQLKEIEFNNSRVLEVIDGRPIES